MTGCEAHIRVELVQDKWKIYKFGEEHNHYFVNEEDMHFLASSRNVSQLHKHMIQSMAKIKTGPVRVFNVMRTIFGVFEEVGVSKVDCKNYKREINLFINEYDAEMMVGNLIKKKEHLPDFSCEYLTDDENCLVGYSMVFVPSTGIDNHNNNVSFGAALLASETAETYKWLLRCFLKAFGKQPDVDVTLCNTTDFKQRIFDNVWTDSLTPDEFEEGWHFVIEDFELSNNNWLDDIYQMRESWILVG
ncbi:hypothetical protein QVD17_30743 [Tagetes erecta]|uniref:Protein FAR1-RELATED SEQUENCE n=1 Tax=Tagetes erecta TaxID=13708 RepID=A0AAD8NN92_TARER|nr:hypothetical protein QVD17_30743 [Tagetes erecta]